MYLPQNLGDLGDLCERQRHRGANEEWDLAEARWHKGTKGARGRQLGIKN